MGGAHSLVCIALPGSTGDRENGIYPFFGPERGDPSDEVLVSTLYHLREHSCLCNFVGILLRRSFILCFVLSPQRVTFRASQDETTSFFFLYMNMLNEDQFLQTNNTDQQNLFLIIFLQHAMFYSGIVHVMYSVIQKHFVLLSHT